MMGRRAFISTAALVTVLAVQASPAGAACTSGTHAISANTARVTLRLDHHGGLLADICDPDAGETAVLRLDRDGRRDRSFAGDGLMGPWPTSEPGDLAIEEDGGVLVETSPARHGDYLLRRFLPDGRVDRAFGARSGSTVIPSDPKFSSPDSTRVFAQPDGHIAVSYHAEQSSCRGEPCEYRAEYIKLHRYSSDGRLLRRRTYYSEYWEYGAAAMTPSGGLVVVGSYQEAGITLLRTGPGLGLDHRFPSRYLQHAGVGEEPEYFPSTDALALAPLHSIITAPAAQPAELRRYRADGSLDRGFGDRGRVDCTDPATNTPTDRGMPFELLETERGRSVLAAGGTGRCGLVRYRSDGSPDPAFGTEGFVDLEALGLPRPEALVLSPGGQVTIAGWDPRRRDFILTRFSRDGRLDRGFGTDGSVPVRVQSGLQD